MIPMTRNMDDSKMLKNQVRPKGLFVTLEGPEGSGKTTLAKVLIRFLKSCKIPALLTHEPGGSQLGVTLRDALLHAPYNVNSWTELFLFEADRAQHVQEVIEPALRRGQVVLCCRFCDSTLAYQGYGRGLNLDFIRQLNHCATQGLEPDLTLLLDVPPRIGLPRALKARGKQDRLESEKLDFHRRLRKGFLDLAKAEPRRIKIILADQPFEKVKKEALQLLVKKLSIRSIER